MKKTTLFSGRKRPLVGIALAAGAMILCWVFYSPLAGLLFAGLFLAAGFLCLPKLGPVPAFCLNALFGIGCILFSCALPTALYGTGSFFRLYWYRIAMNFICAAALYGLCLVLTGRVRSAVGLASGLLMVMATVNFFVFQFRGHELKFSDFFYAATAFNVMGQYRFVIPAPMAYGWLAWLWTVFFLRALPPVPLRPRWVRLGAVAATAACVIVFLSGGRSLKGSGWENEGTLANGFYLNFALGARDSFPERPRGYSPQAVEELAQPYAAPGQPDRRPNVIAILSESFADLSVLGSQLQTNIPVTPFIGSLSENTVKGRALTSIFGGTTANAEFEFLTGCTMALQPSHTVPYVQNIRSDTYSLARLMDSYGYATASTHPFLSSGYDRPRVYPLLGFSESTFDEAYPGAPLVRQYISDRAAYDHILGQLNEQAPQFLFAITMQNHGGYAYEGENYEKTVSLEGCEGSFPQAEQYLSLLRETDRATEEFITALESFPEDTVVLFFGDHLPDLEWELYQTLHGGDFETLDEQMQRYTVPFFIWANFDIPEAEAVFTSLNYLSNHLLKAAGLPLPPYQQFLAEMEEQIPAVNALGYYSKSRQAFLPLRDAEGEEAQWLHRYGLVQYNALFDAKHRNETFFGPFITAPAC